MAKPEQENIYLSEGKKSIALSLNPRTLPMSALKRIVDLQIRNCDSNPPREITIKYPRTSGQPDKLFTHNRLRELKDSLFQDELVRKSFYRDLEDHLWLADRIIITQKNK